MVIFHHQRFAQQKSHDSPSAARLCSLWEAALEIMPLWGQDAGCFPWIQRFNRFNHLQAGPTPSLKPYLVGTTKNGLKLEHIWTYDIWFSDFKQQLGCKNPQLVKMGIQPTRFGDILRINGIYNHLKWWYCNQPEYGRFPADGDGHEWTPEWWWFSKSWGAQV